MSSNYTIIENLNELITDIPSDSIISRTFHEDDQLKVILFGFAQDQELSEHTASTQAILHFLKGEAMVTLGGDHYEVASGAWVHMPPRQSHSIKALTPTIMLLFLYK